MEKKHEYLQMQKDFYNDLAIHSDYVSNNYREENDQEHVVGNYAMNEKYDWETPLFKNIEKLHEMDALEYGCGPGRMVKRLVHMFNRLDGVDLSEEVLNVARQHFTESNYNSSFFLNDGSSLPMIEDESYHLVFSVICLQHICVYSIRKKILSEMFRVLKNGGIVSFQMGYGTGHPNPARYTEECVDAQATNGAFDVMILHPWEPVKDLIEIGFKNIRYSIEPICAGDSHSAWIFIQAQKLGNESQVIIQNNSNEIAEDDLKSSFTYYEDLLKRHSILNRLSNVEQEVERQSADLSSLQNTINQLSKKNENLEGESKSLKEKVSSLLAVRMKDIFYLCKSRKLSLALFGAGEHTATILSGPDFTKDSIDAIYDNNKALWGQEFHSIAVHNPELIPTDLPDIILISSKAFAREIEEQLKSIDTGEALIVNLYP